MLMSNVMFPQYGIHFFLILYCVAFTYCSSPKNLSQIYHNDHHVPSLMWTVELDNPSDSLHHTRLIAEQVSQATGLLIAGSVNEDNLINSVVFMYDLGHPNSRKNLFYFSTDSPGYFNFSAHDIHARAIHSVQDKHLFHNIRDSIENYFESNNKVKSYIIEVLLPRNKRFIVDKKDEFIPKFRDPAFPNQWHLLNRVNKHRDINVTGVWKAGITGQNVVVCILDDGMEHSNKDLVDSYCAEGSYDVNDNDHDPTPTTKANDNFHGTRCSGEVAAQPNDFCSVGVAYGAKVSAVRILDGKVTDLIESRAINYANQINDIYSLSWGPTDNGKLVDGLHKHAQETLESSIKKGRNGLGNIYVVAAGNGGGDADNCNFDGYANSIYTVTIGAITELFEWPSYSELCASVASVTFSNGGVSGITTTDWHLLGGDGCTDSFSGTSAAAPMAAGIIALMLSAQPKLNWRDVQHIIAIGSLGPDTVSSNGEDYDYQEIIDRLISYVEESISKLGFYRERIADAVKFSANKVGLFHSHAFGFGQMKAWPLVQISRIWESVPQLVQKEIKNKDFKPVEIEKGGKVVSTIEVNHVSDLNSLEYVQVSVYISHPIRGNLFIELVCPSGTVSLLATPRPRDTTSDSLHWIFSTMRCWGESPIGKWTLIVHDMTSETTRLNKSIIFHNWFLILSGSEISYEDFLTRVRRAQMAVNSASIPTNNGNYIQTTELPKLFNQTIQPTMVKQMRISIVWKWGLVFIFATSVTFVFLTAFCLASRRTIKYMRLCSYDGRNENDDIKSLIDDEADEDEHVVYKSNPIPTDKIKYKALLREETEPTLKSLDH